MGYTPEVSKELTCFDESGQIIVKEPADNIIIMNIDPIAIRLTYPEILNEYHNNIGQEASIVSGVDGCTFQTNYTSTDLSEMRETAPMLVTIFDSTQKSLIEQRYTSIDYSTDVHVFSAEFRDSGDNLLETIEVIGLPAIGLSTPPEPTQ